MEYILSSEGRIDYVGGTFCYHSNAVIDLAIPDGAVPVQALIYDLHEPDEIIRITFTQRERRRSPDPDTNRGEMWVSENG